MFSILSVWARRGKSIFWKDRCDYDTMGGNRDTTKSKHTTSNLHRSLVMFAHEATRYITYHDISIWTNADLQAFIQLNHPWDGPKTMALPQVSCLSQSLAGLYAGRLLWGGKKKPSTKSIKGLDLLRNLGFRSKQR